MKTKTTYSTQNGTIKKTVLKYPVLWIFMMLFLATFSYSQTATATFNLTSNGNATIVGAVSGTAVIGSGINTPTFSAADGVTTDGWANDGSSRNTNEYYEYEVTPTTGNKLTITSVTLNHSVSAGNWLGAVYYSYDGFATTGIQIGSNFVSSTTTQTALSLTGLSLTVPTGGSFTIRVYGWESDGPNRKFRNRNVVISGTTCVTPSISVQPVTQGICSGSSLDLFVTAANATSYQWKKNTVSISGATSSTYSIVSTVAGDAANYTVDVTNSCQTITSNTAVVTINALPTAITISPSSATVCLNAITTLTASGGVTTGVPILVQNFNGATNNWTLENTSSGATPANAAWKLRPNSYNYDSGTIFNSNDNSQFYLSNSDEQGTGGTTSTRLVSPSFDLTGSTGASLSFYHYFRYNTGETAKVQISTNGGTTWSSTDLASYTSTRGSVNAFELVTIDLTPYISFSNVKIRFNYAATFDWYWAIDNVTVSGTKSGVTWSPLTGLYSDSLATTPYAGEVLPTVYAKVTANSTFTAKSTSPANCSSTKTVTLTIAPNVTITPFSPATGIRCQGAGTFTATTTATNSSGITYTLDSGTADFSGNSINISTGTVTFVAGWSGITTITANAAGCNGPATTPFVLTVTPTVGTPSFTAGATTVCQDAADTTYTATATNNTGITYSVSPAAAGTIGSSNGIMNWNAAFSGNATITASATGCNGPKTFDRVVTVLLPVGTPTFTVGATTVCQDAADTTYTATATNTTGITYSVLPAGAGTINASSGVMNWSSTFSGTATITATAAGCSGPTTADRVVMVTPSVTTPVFLAGATSVCQDAADETYTATADNTTGIAYSVSPVGAGTIGSSTGIMNWNAAYSGSATITASAAGCSGPKTATRTVTVTGTVATPSFTVGATSVCQDAANTTYTATALNSTSITYSVLPLNAGTIGASSGVMDWDSGFFGNATITATANGCGGPKTFDRIVTVSQSVTTPSFTSPVTALCQDAADTTYAATAANSTGITFTVSPAAAGTIGSTTGIMNWGSSFSGNATITASAAGCSGPKTVNVVVVITPSVATPSFTVGDTSVCQDAANETYTATAANNTGISYSLSAAAAGTINPSTGEVDWDPNFSGNVNIIASAMGCNGPKTANKSVTVTATVGTPTFSSGSTAVCQNASTSTYIASASDSTSITYSVSPAAAGTMTNFGFGFMDWSSTFSGTAIITATANGCNGPKIATRVVIVTPTVGTPVFTVGASTVCQNAANELYTATATDATAITYSVSPSGAGTIGSSTGIMDWNPTFTGTATITASAAGCNGPKTTPKTVTVIPSVSTPSFTAGATSVCQDASNITYTATATNTTGITYSVLPVAAGTIDSSTGSMDWDASFSGTATITASAAGCNGPLTAVRVVTVRAKANAGTDGALIICAGSTVTLAQLNAAITGEDAGGSWTPALAGAGIYTYTVNATSPCTAPDTSIVVVTEQAGPNAGTDGALTICEGSTVTLAQLNAAITGEDLGGSWTPALAGAGTYTYTVAATSPCTTPDTSVVVVTEQAGPNAGTDGVYTICSGTNITLAQLQAAITGEDAGGSWSPALGGAGTYTYTVNATSPCAIPDTSVVVVSAVSCQATQLSNCGNTPVLTSVNSRIFAGTTVTQSTKYRYRVAVSTAPLTYFYAESIYPSFRLTDVVGLTPAYGTTYNVEIQNEFLLSGNTVASAYGTLCTVTTQPANNIAIAVNQCGQTLAAVNSKIYVNGITGATMYTYRIAKQSAPTTYSYIETPYSNFRLTNPPTSGSVAIEHNTDYIVAVSVTTPSGVSDFNSPCLVTTPVGPSTTIQGSQCGDDDNPYVIATSSTKVYAANLVSGATYTFKLEQYSGNVLVDTNEATSPINYFNTNMFTGDNSLLPDTNYHVYVRINYFGEGDYDHDCVVRTPVALKNEEMTQQFTALAYPNPFANNFMIDVKSTSESAVNLKVYDMIGRLIDQKDVRVSDLETTAIGNNYPSGVYNVVVSQENSTQTVRVVKR